MDKETKNKLKGIMTVPIGLAVVLVPFSIFIGWNLLTLILFWFVVVPGLTIYLPSIVTRKRSHLFESLVGLIIFYAGMVFMIYDHYVTDYFQMMVLSFVINLILVSILAWTKRTWIQTH